MRGREEEGKGPGKEEWRGRKGSDVFIRTLVLSSYIPIPGLHLSVVAFLKASFPNAVMVVGKGLST